MPGDNIEHVLSEDEAVRMHAFGEDPESEETLRREWEEASQNVPRIQFDEGGYPARDMSPEALQHMADYNGLEEMTEENLTEELGLEKNPDEVEYLSRELPKGDTPEQGELQCWTVMHRPSTVQHSITML